MSQLTMEENVFKAIGAFGVWDWIGSFRLEKVEGMNSMKTHNHIGFSYLLSTRNLH